MSQPKKRNGNVLTLVLTAFMAAVICILGPLSIPIGMVPISFTNLAIYFAVILLGWKYGTLSCIIYLLIGFAGVPVFSGFSAGAGKLFGPTGGYLIGFIFMALISGVFIEKFQGKQVVYILGMILGTLVCYVFGTAWLSYQAGYSFSAALAVGVYPFIIGDLIKIVIATFLGPIMKSALVKASLLNQ